MVRQGHLELLASADITDAEMHASRGIASFIKHFLEEIHPNLQYEAESIVRQKAGLPALNQTPEGDPYMEMSGDPNESPRDLTTVNH